MVKKVLVITLIGVLLMLCGCVALDKVVDKAERGASALQGTINQVLPNTNWATTGIAGLIALLGFYKKWRADSKLKTVITGVESVKKNLNEGKSAQAINDILKSVAVAYNLYPDIKKDVQAVQLSLTKK